MGGDSNPRYRFSRVGPSHAMNTKGVTGVAYGNDSPRNQSLLLNWLVNAGLGAQVLFPESDAADRCYQRKTLVATNG